MTADLGARFGFEMRSLLLRKSQELSLHQFDEVGVSSMITRTTSDITNLQQTMGMVLQMVVPAPLIVGASIVMTAMVTPVMAVIQVGFMAALAAASAGIYSGYVEQAREAELYETAEQIKNALAICEAQYGEAGGSDASVFWSEAFLAPPNHRDSVLYPYVGTMTEDCTGYSLKIKRNGEGRYFIAGFTYSTEEYEITWKKNDGITVKKRGKS